MAEESSESTPSRKPAWATNLGESTWAVQWEVPGATRYELRHLPAYPRRDTGPMVVARAATAEELTFDPAAAEEPGTYLAVAFAEDRTVPAGWSAVGFGDPAGKADISKLLRDWGEWSKLHPFQPAAKTPTGNKEVTTVRGVKRTKQTYVLTKNPDEIITFNPNINACFPGSIVQSQLAVARGYLIPAGIDDSDRADLNITVDRLTGRRETASPPSASSVTAAIGKIVGDDTPGSSDLVYRRTEAYSSVQVALQLGISGSYGGFAASLDVEGKHEETKNTVLVYLRERAFTAFCDTSTPEALFKESFTEDKVTRLVGLEKMGPGNPPLLVNSVVYGRILVFTMTSSSSQTEINASLKASYSAFANVSAEAKAHYQQVLRNSDVSIVGKAVPPEMIKGLLEDGTLNTYFSTKPKYKEYGMIGYTLQTLDGVPAEMSETVTYDEVVWGEDAGTVTLNITGFEIPGQSCWSGTVTLDGEVLSFSSAHPASTSRHFEADGSGEPFHLTDFRSPGSGAVVHGRWEISPKELKWFTDGKDVASGRYETEPFAFLNYAAHRS